MKRMCAFFWGVFAKGDSLTPDQDPWITACTTDETPPAISHGLGDALAQDMDLDWVSSAGLCGRFVRDGVAIHVFGTNPA